MGKVRFKKLNIKGFTIVELNITLILLVIVNASFLAIFINFLITSSRTNTITQLTSDSQSLLRILTEELRYGSGVRQTNAINDPNAPAGGWNTSNTNFVIITTTLAQDSNDNFIIDPNTGRPYNNEFVYYRQDNELYKRTLVDPNATGNKLRTSCPEALATASCPADRKLVENLNSISFTFYDQDNIVTTDPLLARSISINLVLTQDVFGNDLDFANSIRVTLRNIFV